MLTLRRILVPTDFSPCAEQALAHAAFLARGYGASIDLAHVIPVAPGYPLAGVRAEDTEDAAEVERRLREIVDDEGLGNVDVRTHVTRGEDGVGTTLLDTASNVDADLIVLGTHGRRGMRRLFLGSEAEEVIRGSDRPVLAVRQQQPSADPADIGRVLVPLDLSEHSVGALEHAVDLARQYEAHLHLLHVVQPLPDYELPGIYQSSLPPRTDVTDALTDSAREELAGLAEQVDLPTSRVHWDVQHGDPASVIVDTAEDDGADLIVLASHGRTGLERFLMGSVAEKTIRLAPCPVFVVKAYGRRLVGPNP